MFGLLHAADNVRQRRTRGAQKLNVRQRVRFAFSRAAAFLNSLREFRTSPRGFAYSVF